MHLILESIGTQLLHHIIQAWSSRRANEPDADARSVQDALSARFRAIITQCVHISVVCLFLAINK